MPEVGETKMRYPGNDPENGPAYRQRWNGTGWECAEHRWEKFEEPIIDDDGNATGEVFEEVVCSRCGAPKRG